MLLLTLSSNYNLLIRRLNKIDCHKFINGGISTPLITNPHATLTDTIDLYFTTLRSFLESTHYSSPKPTIPHALHYLCG